MNQARPDPCPHCGTNRWRPRFPVEGSTIHQCGGCGLLATGPSLDAKALTDLYSGSFYDARGQRFRLGLADRLMKSFRQGRARQIHRLLRGPSRILDVGCGRGFTMAALRDLGHEVHGTQLSAEAAAFAREVLALEGVQQKDLMEVGYPQGWFDVVTVYHVLEHLPDPHAFLREVARILRPGGLLIVEVPDAGGVCARFTGRFWLGWDVPYHRFHFTRETLGQALNSAGFTVGRWSHPWVEYGAAVVVLSLLNVATHTENKLFRTLTFTGDSASRISGIRLAGHLLAAVVLGVPGILLALAGSLAGAGEIMAVCSWKAGSPLEGGVKDPAPGAS